MRNRLVLIKTIIAVVFLSIGATLAIGFTTIAELDEANSEDDVNKLLSQDNGYSLLKDQFVWGDPDENIELRRYALKQIVDGGSSGYGMTLAFRAATDPDMECRKYYLEMLNQELLAYHGLSMKMLAGSLHRESDEQLYQKKIDLILDFACLDRNAYQRKLEQTGKKDALSWLLEEIIALEQRRENENN
ncbi:MAG: hypothetical protein AAF711_05155 [Planctomycetota bacterium]